MRLSTLKLVSIAALLSALQVLIGCSTTSGPTSPLQRQAVETSYVEGDYETIFRATRTAFQNDGYMVEQSEIASGFLQFSRQVRDKDARLAAALGLLPGGGSFYVGSYLLGVVDLLLWPFSVAWDVPISAATAHKSRKSIQASVTMVDLGDRTEIRTGFMGEEVDAEYAIGLKRLYAEIQRQVMMREHRDEEFGSAEVASQSQQREESVPDVARAGAAENGPEATVRIESRSISLGVGVTWGDGTLTYDGEDHAFSLRGLSLADLGVSKASVSGEVHRLNELSDFPGTYVAAETGIAVGRGIGALTLSNTNGVVLTLWARQEGVRLTAAKGGLNVELK